MLKIGIDVRPMINNPAGIGYYVKGLVAALSKIDKENLYLLYADKDFEVLSKKSFKKVIVNKKGVFWHLSVYRDAKSSKLDVYHSTHSLLLPIFPFLKTVVTYHDASAVLFPQKHSLRVRIISKILFSLAAKRAKHIIVPSEATKRDVINITKISESQISVVAEGVNELGVTWNKDTENPYIFFIGTLEPRKNIDNLLRAYKILKERYNAKEKLIIAGGKGWLSSHLLSLVKSLGISDSVRFMGYVYPKEKEELFSKASVFVFPSLYEGFGLPVLEAMSAGVPVVTSNISSLPEVAGEAAVLVPPNDPEKIAEAIFWILSNEDKSFELSRKGLAQARRFSWERCAKNTLEIYKKVSKNL